MDASANRPGDSLAGGDSGQALSAGNSAGEMISPVRGPNAPLWNHPSGSPRILHASVGDHSRVLALLVQQRQIPLADEFQSRIDEPGYSVDDRLLVEHQGQLVGHLQLTHQIAWFENERIPMCRMRDACILEEFAAMGICEPMLATAERCALEGRAIVAFARPEKCKDWLAQGWRPLRGQGFTQVNTRALLAHVSTEVPPRSHRKPGLEVRPWKHFELDAIRPIYEQMAAAKWGPNHRSEELWRWLMGRKAHGQILVASRLDVPADSATPGADLVGYAVIRDSHVVEMAALPGNALVRRMLLAQACREALDRELRVMTLHTCPTDPLHDFLVTAGGSWIAEDATSPNPWLFKLLDPARWIERMYPVLTHRAREANLSRPLTLVFAVGSAFYRLQFTRRSIRLEPETDPSQVDVSCSRGGFQDLLFGNLRVSDAIEGARIRLRKAELAETLAVLFPPRLFWQSPFEMLQL